MERLEAQAQQHALTSAESSLVQADNPVADRIAVAINYMLKLFAESKGAKSHLGLKLGTKLVTEMMSDLKDSDMPPIMMEFYIKQLGSMILWCATGVKDETLPWPADFEI
jgi:hypothetical protein